MYPVNFRSVSEKRSLLFSVSHRPCVNLLHILICCCKADDAKHFALRRAKIAVSFYSVEHTRRQEGAETRYLRYVAILSHRK